MIVASRHLNPKIAKCGAKLSTMVTCVACHTKMFGQGSGRSLAGANPSSQTFLAIRALALLWWLAVGALGARIRALALLWRLALGARVRALALFLAVGARGATGRESEPTNFWANPSPGTFAGWRWRCRSPIRAHKLLGANPSLRTFAGRWANPSLRTFAGRWIKEI